jgi:hypothetical protein
MSGLLNSNADVQKSHEIGNYNGALLARPTHIATRYGDDCT